MTTRYLDAVVKEALRLRPVIPGVGRVVRERPFRLGAYEVPVGVEINPSIRTIHRRADLYPDPEEFSPERFLAEDAPDTYTWVPFGGGTRRCLGASFALTEMRVVLARVLERTALSAGRSRPGQGAVPSDHDRCPRAASRCARTGRRSPRQTAAVHRRRRR